MRGSIGGGAAIVRTLIGAAGFAATAFTATGASAASVEIKNAIAKVTIIPEARSDVAVTVVRDDPHHPLKVGTWPDGRTVVDGGYFGGFFGGVGITNCNSHGGMPHVRIFGRESVDHGTMAEVVIHVPLDARVSAGGGGYGGGGRAGGLDLRGPG